MDTSPIQRLMEGPMASYRERALKGNATGSESGRIARFGALEEMIRRRQRIREMSQGSPGGKYVRRNPDLSSSDVEKMIRGR